MASARYTLNITPEQPEEKHEMTAKEKRSNFWFYYKWHILVAVVAVALVSMFVHDIVSQVKPDYQIAILSTYNVPDQMISAMEEQLSLLTEDRNGDGKAYVSVVCYAMQPTADSSPAQDDAASTAPNLATNDPYTQMAGVTKLMSDGQSGTSMLFLTNDLAGFQAQTAMFAYNDGSTPAEGVPPDLTRLGKRWGDCPVLAQLPLGNLQNMDGTEGASMQSLLQDYVLLKRVIKDTSLEGNEKAEQYYADACVLFDKLTAEGGAQK